MVETTPLVSEKLTNLVDFGASAESQALVAAAMSGPAPLATRTLINVYGPIVRLAFVEAEPDGKNPAFRSAVTLHVDQVIKLTGVLTQLLLDMKAAGLIAEEKTDGEG